MSAQLRFTSRDLECLPEVESKRYEIIDGELFASRSPHFFHQYTGTKFTLVLGNWSEETKQGLVAAAPGVIFAEDDDVIPDVIWIRTERLATGMDAAGHLHVAPDLVVEVLSPGSANEHRDRELKLKLYSRRGVREYWSADWQRRELQVFRRQSAQLELVATLHDEDVLESPLLPGFRCVVGSLWPPVSLTS